MPVVKTDPYSQAPLFIKLSVGEHDLASATAFFYRSAGNLYLVSNWHNYSGRDPRTLDPLSTTTAGVPDTVSCYLCLAGAFIVREWHSFPLLRNGVGLWYEHPQDRHAIDIGVLPVALPDKFQAIPINDRPATELRLRVSDDVFVLGYPLGLIGSHGMPLWKRASVASEPGTSEPSFLVDTATRSGMSGSPVVQRYRGFYKHDENNPGVSAQDWFGEADSFVGIYSGRLGASQLEAQLGIVWKKRLIEEIVNGARSYES